MQKMYVVKLLIFLKRTNFVLLKAEGFEQVLVHVAKAKGKKLTPNRWINKSGEY